jgi:serine/threonine protein phosphatase PrpC
MARPADNTTDQCPDCGSSYPHGSADFCAECGTHLEGPQPPDLAHVSETKPLDAGARVGGQYVVEKVRFRWDGEIVYDAEASERGERVLIVERDAAGPDPLADAGFARPGESEPADPNPFHTEYALLTKFDYSGIVSARETFLDGERAYLVLDGVDGELLTSLERASEGEVRAWGLQICQSVNLLHRHGFVHNGIEPSSFILDAQRRLKLIRFHRCRPAGVFSSDAPTPIAAGFSAPELYRLETDAMVDVRSDVYSIGACLYHLLSSHTLDTNEPSLMETGELSLYPDLVVAPGFERILNRALAPDPEDRYRSVNEMKLALADLSVTVNVRAGHFTDVGKVRELNEDSLLVLNLTQYFESVQTHIGLYIVSDGMGGEAAGEIASRVTVRAIAEWITDKLISASLRSTHGERIAAETETGGVRLASSSGADIRASELLTNAIMHANREVLQYARLNPNARGLGATVTVGLLVGNSLTIGHVGDSRAYVISARGIEQVTEDHSIVERMVREGQIEREEARDHPYRNVIYRSIGCRDEIGIDIVRCMLRSGDTLVLCSDGLNGMLTDAEIRDAVLRNREPSQGAKELVVAANARGGEDNISVVVVTVL